MIKYPVRVGKGFNKLTGEFLVEDSARFHIATCDTRDWANTIANSLNALHEFPDVSNSADTLIDWMSKYIKE